MKTTAFILSFVALSVLANDGPQFGYSGSIGPKLWGTLDKEWKTCRDGKEQSPINLDSAPAAHQGVLPQYAWQPTTNVALGVGKHGGLDGDLAAHPGKITLTYNGESYSAIQFHLHHQSEHTVGDKNDYYPLEMHIVSQKEGGSKVVTGVMFRVASDSNSFIAAIAASLPLQGNQPSVIPQLDFGELYRQCSNFANAWTYMGSLTTPPCTEGVKWVVSRVVLPITQEDLTTITTAIGPSNSRPTQRGT